MICDIVCENVCDIACVADSNVLLWVFLRNWLRKLYKSTTFTILFTNPHLSCPALFLFIPPAAEERKRVEDKEYHKRYQEVLFKENQENLVRKAEERARAFAEEK